MEHIFDLPDKPLNSNKFYNETGWSLFTNEDGKLIISGDCSKTQAETALNAHNGATPEATIEHKLASVGLNLDDLKAALGL